MISPTTVEERFARPDVTTSARSSPRPPPEFVSDRQADESMRRFTRLTEGFTVDGYPVAGALRYAFFADCLRTSRYLGYAPTKAAYWFTAAACGYDAEPAAVLFAREGDSTREWEHIEPVGRWLGDRGVAARLIREPRRARWRRAGSAVASALRWRALLPGLRANVGKIDAAGLQVRAEFGLSAAFVPWFRFQTAFALARYHQAYRALRDLSPRPNVIVLNTEYHHLSRAVLSAGRALGIPTVLVQHGFLGQEWLHWPIVSERICVWGEVDRQWYLARGQPAETIVLTGTHRACAVEARARAAARTAAGLAREQRAVVFFAPNLGLAYHRRAARFLDEARVRVGASCRWFVRLHPSQAEAEHAKEYSGFTTLAPTLPLTDACALADLVLHDYSTMAFAEFAGVRTATLALDPPYPAYYRDLRGDQREIASVDDLCRRVLDLDPGYGLTSAPTRTMAAGGVEALAAVGAVIREVGVC